MIDLWQLAAMLKLRLVIEFEKLHHGWRVSELPCGDLKLVSSQYFVLSWNKNILKKGMSNGPRIFSAQEKGPFSERNLHVGRMSDYAG